MYGVEDSRGGVDSFMTQSGDGLHRSRRAVKIDENLSRLSANRKTRGAGGERRERRSL